jgi:hypothetical protein
MGGRLTFNYSGIIPAYTGNVAERLKDLKKVLLYGGTKAYHIEFRQTFKKFGIDTVFVDKEVQKVLNKDNGKLAKEFIYECKNIPAFPLQHSPEMAEEKRHELRNALNIVFIEKRIGINIVPSNDFPHIYLLNNVESQALLKMLRAKVAVVEEEKPPTSPCPSLRTLALLLKGSWSHLISKEYKERVSRHVKDCEPCGENIMKMKKLRPRNILTEEFLPMRSVVQKEPEAKDPEVKVLNDEEIQTAKDMASSLAQVPPKACDPGNTDPEKIA